MTARLTFIPVIADEVMFTFESQSKQFPKTGPRGITRWHVDENPDNTLSQPIQGPAGNRAVIDVLLYRLPRHRLLVGILYHYRSWSRFEKPGNINIYVHPDHRRQGIGTALVRAWQVDNIIQWEQQRYSLMGAKFAAALNNTERE